MNNDNTSSSKSSLLSKWRNRNKKKDDDVQITEIPKDVAIPLSSEQKRLWFLQQLFPNNPFYNYSELYRLQGNIKKEDFEKSIRLVENTHDILRSTFHVIDGIPRVKINEKSDSIFSYYDFSKEIYEIAYQKANVIVRKNASQTFYLSNETLMQSTLIKVAENDFLFLIVMHHIITDKWSMKVFRKELASHYSNLVKGITPKIEKPKIQYASYAYWQQHQEINSEHLAYWKEKLSGEISALNLPTDFPKKAQPTYKGTFHKQVYSEEFSSNFFKLCKQLEATPYVTMLSVYYVLLQKYSQQEDILVGTPITKRNRTSLENLIGFFNDTLVLRTNVQKNSSFKELVKSVKTTTLDAFSNKDISFDTLVKTIKPTRSLSLHPFFQVMFLYHKVPETPTLGEDIKITYEPYDAGVAKFDLTLYISEDKGNLMSLMEYETDLFKKATIERMHTHFEEILRAVIHNPEHLLNDIIIETEEEAEFYKTVEAPVLAYKNSYNGIHELITANAIRNANKTAVIYKDSEITYKELDEESTKLARTLLEEGVQKNDIIGLSVERSTNLIVSVLGILKAGAAYLPLDPEFPIERTSYILNDANVKVVVAQQHLIANFDIKATKIIAIDDLDSTTISNNVQLPKVEDSDLVYVIYTSGSTGVPKGVPIAHGNIINSTLARTDFYGYDPDIFLLMSSISFDSSKAGLFWTLCSGGTLVISEKHLEQDINQLVETIHQHKVTHTLMLPSLYANVINFGNSRQLQFLDTVIVAGEACTNQIVKNHFDILPKVNLYNEYGPTEATVWCIAHQLKLEDGNTNNIPIGRPIRNVQVYLLNDDLQKVPYGTAGQLYIGGLGLSKGYINDTKKTKISFISNPFKSNDFLYKTGDLAKFNADGNIEFLGRKDQQVKIRGYRIELDEIEQQIAASKQVEEVIVLAQKKSDSIDWAALESASANEILQTLKNYLPETTVQELLSSVENIEEGAAKVVLDNL